MPISRFLVFLYAIERFLPWEMNTVNSSLADASRPRNRSIIAQKRFFHDYIYYAKIIE
jgi:hypothetical protein